MGVVYLVYGFAFLATGLTLALQARLPIGILGRPAPTLLAAFALVHGVAEWVYMSEGLFAPLQLRWADTVALILLALSFVLLLQFAIELKVTISGWPRKMRLVPVALAAGALALVYGVHDRLAEAEIAIRYALGLPAALLAADGFRVVVRRGVDATPRTVRLFQFVAFVFLGYAFFAGLVVPPAAFLPAAQLNTATFLAVTHVPVQAVRATCALALGWAFSEAFVVEFARRRLQAEQQREEFIGVVAHDLRAPITTIELTASLIERRLSGEDPRVLELAERVRSSGHKLERMVADLLDASRIEARRLSVEPVRLDLRVLILAFVECSWRTASTRPLRTVIESPLPVMADPDRVEQVLTNLLSNAAKYSRADTEIVVQASPRADEVEVAVTNVGPGLEPEEARHVFKRHYRTSRARSAAPGLGMGLYIAKGLVEAQRGRIWVESQPGKQTTFCFTLPRASTTASRP